MQAGVVTHTCEICGQNELTTDEIRRHQAEVHSSSPTIKCLFCDLQGVTHNELQLHINTVHFGRYGDRNATQEIVAEKLEDKDESVKCFFCDLQGVTRDELELHVNTVHFGRYGDRTANRHIAFDKRMNNVLVARKHSELTVEQLNANTEEEPLHVGAPERPDRSLLYSRDNPSSVEKPNELYTDAGEKYNCDINGKPSSESLDKLLKLDRAQRASAVLRNHIPLQSSSSNVYLSISETPNGSKLVTPSVSRCNYKDDDDADPFGDKEIGEWYSAVEEPSEFSDFDDGVRKCPVCDCVVDNNFFLSLHFTAQHSAPRPSVSLENDTLRDDTFKNYYDGPSHNDDALSNEGSFDDRCTKKLRFDNGSPEFIKQRYGLDVPSTLLCPVCSLEFKDEQQLQYHVNRHFNNEDGIQPPSERFTRGSRAKAVNGYAGGSKKGVQQNNDLQDDATRNSVLANQRAQLAERRARESASFENSKASRSSTSMESHENKPSQENRSSSENRPSQENRPASCRSSSLVELQENRPVPDVSVSRAGLNQRGNPRQALGESKLPGNETRKKKKVPTATLR